MSCCCCGPRGRRGLETETAEQQRLVQPPKSESSSLFEVGGRVRALQHHRHLRRRALCQSCLGLRCSSRPGTAAAGGGREGGLPCTHPACLTSWGGLTLEARGQASDSEKVVGDFAGAEEDVVDAGVPDRE